MMELRRSFVRSQGRPTLRWYPWVALGLIVAPILPMTVFGLLPILPDLLRGQAISRVDLKISFIVLVVGLVICYLVEIIIVVPAILYANFYRPRLLSFPYASLIGFVIGGLFPLLLAVWMALTASSGSSYSANGTDILVDGRMTLMGWLDALARALPTGIIGAAAAATFQLLAVRRSAPDACD